MEFEFFLEHQIWGQRWGYSKPHPPDCIELFFLQTGYPKCGPKTLNDILKNWRISLHILGNLYMWDIPAVDRDFPSQIWDCNIALRCSQGDRVPCWNPITLTKSRVKKVQMLRTRKFWTVSDAAVTVSPWKGIYFSWEKWHFIGFHANLLQTKAATFTSLNLPIIHLFLCKSKA